VISYGRICKKRWVQLRMSSASPPKRWCGSRASGTNRSRRQLSRSGRGGCNADSPALDATLIDNWVVGRPTSSSVLQARKLINPPADRPAGLTRDGGRLHSCTGDPDRRERLHGHIPDAKYNLGLSIRRANKRTCQYPRDPVCASRRTGGSKSSCTASPVTGYDQQCLGMDSRLARTTPRGRCRPDMLRPEKSTRRTGCFRADTGTPMDDRDYQFRANSLAKSTS